MDSKPPKKFEKIPSARKENDYERLKKKFNFSNNNNCFRKVVNRHSLEIKDGNLNFIGRTIQNNQGAAEGNYINNKCNTGPGISQHSNSQNKQGFRHGKIINPTPIRNKAVNECMYIEPGLEINLDSSGSRISKEVSTSMQKEQLREDNNCLHKNMNAITQGHETPFQNKKDQIFERNIAERGKLKNILSNVIEEKAKECKSKQNNNSQNQVGKSQGNIKSFSEELTTERKSRQIIHDSEEIFSQNYGLKEAIINCSETYNSLYDNVQGQENILQNINDYTTSSEVTNTMEGNKAMLNNILLNKPKNEFQEESLSNIKINENYNFVINFNNYVMTGGGDTDTSNIKNTHMQSNIIDNYVSSQEESLYKKYHCGKIKKTIFQNNPAYNLSSRLINDEKNKCNISENNLSKKNIPCKFIEVIKSTALSSKLKEIHSKISLVRFLKMKDDTFITLLTFCYDDIDEIKKSYKSICDKVNLCLNKKYCSIIQAFRDIYCKDFELYEHYFALSTSNPHLEDNNIITAFNTIYFSKTHNRKPQYISLDLYLKAKIISSKINSTFCFSCIYNYIKSKEVELIKTWKFDLKKKSEVHVWVASEAEEYESKITRFCYLQPIISYSPEDFCEIKITVFAKNSILDCPTVKWTPMLYEKSPEMNIIDYEKSAFTNSHSSFSKKFDKMRHCDLENFVHVWKNESLLTNRDLVKDVHKFFSSGKHFQIISFTYDMSKFYLFKVKMKAIKPGIVKRNKYLDFDIEIKEYDKSISNETQCLGLLNFSNKKYELRVGQFLIFYFTDIYG